MTPEDNKLIRQEVEQDPLKLGYPPIAELTCICLEGPTFEEAELVSNTVAMLMASQGEVANPAPQGTVPWHLDTAELIAGLCDESAVKIMAWPHLNMFLECVTGQDRPAVVRWGFMLRHAGIITPDEHTALLNLCNATRPDPDWRAKLPGPNRLSTVLGREIVALTGEELLAALSEPV